MTSFSELREGTLKTAVFTFGRFNPPTIGHEVLVNKIELWLNEIEQMLLFLQVLHKIQKRIHWTIKIKSNG